jgi:hypothetical protein
VYSMVTTYQHITNLIILICPGACNIKGTSYG